jgi:hypothetical protein
MFDAIGTSIMDDFSYADYWMAFELLRRSPRKDTFTDSRAIDWSRTFPPPNSDGGAPSGSESAQRELRSMFSTEAPIPLFAWHWLGESRQRELPFLPLLPVVINLDASDADLAAAVDRLRKRYGRSLEPRDRASGRARGPKVWGSLTPREAMELHDAVVAGETIGGWAKRHRRGAIKADIQRANRILKSVREAIANDPFRPLRSTVNRPVLHPDDHVKATGDKLAQVDRAVTEYMGPNERARIRAQHDHRREAKNTSAAGSTAPRA